MNERIGGPMNSQEFVDSMIRVGMIAILVYWCHKVFQPFMNLMLWSLVLAVTLYPLHRRLTKRFNGKQAWAATVLVVISIACLVVPLVLLTDSLLTSAQAGLQTVKGDGIELPAPPASINDWPLIGERLYSFWNHAATDSAWAAQQLAPHLKDGVRNLMLQLVSIGTAVLLFIAALIIAGIIVVFGESGHRASIAIATRLTGPERGPRLVSLCTATIRAVAQGVVGIAFIQMVMIGMALVAVDFPGAGVLAIVVLLFGIAQLPVILITAPIIGYVLMNDGFTMTTIIFSIWMLIGGLADNVLKPLLLGRGVDVPMPVVLFGALGGMVTGGVIGLFIGPVILAIGYQLFMAWVYRSVDAPPSVPSQEIPPQ